LPKRRCRLHRGSRRDPRLDDGWLACGSAWRAALKRPQALLELPVAVLQFLVLAGELPQMILKLLDSHFRVDVTGLREGPRTQRQHC
jgi:hypothetical protein